MLLCMARPRTGSIVLHGDHYDARVTLPGGKRRRECLPAGLTEAAARALALTISTKRAKAPVVVPIASEAADAWAERWFADRERRGLTSVGDDRGRWSKWISTSIGKRPMATIETIELEQLVEKLDAHVLAGDLGAKTAKNAWGLVSKAFDDAARSKTTALRCRKDNPAAGVRGPDPGVKRSKAYLYPSEFLALVSCPRVSLRWRRLFAFAVYSYMRAGEIEALEVEDIDRAAQRFHVHRSMDRSEDDKTKATKTMRSRHCPIEARLAPLLDVLIADAPLPRLWAMPPECDLSSRLRKYLKWAGITRAELFARDATRKRLTFHDLRATGITWMALRGDDPLKIQGRAGHANFNTTQGYIREAESHGAGIGEPFPVLPADLVSANVSAETPATWGQLGGNIRQNLGVPSGIRSRLETQSKASARDSAGVLGTAAKGTPRAGSRKSAACRVSPKPWPKPIAALADAMFAASILGSESDFMDRMLQGAADDETLH